ncbi:pheromone-regulated protein prm10, partial [Mycoemilia scoparia]
IMGLDNNNSNSDGSGGISRSDKKVNRKEPSENEYADDGDGDESSTDALEMKITESRQKLIPDSQKYQDSNNESHQWSGSESSAQQPDHGQQQDQQQLELKETIKRKVVQFQDKLATTSVNSINPLFNPEQPEHIIKHQAEGGVYSTAIEDAKAISRAAAMLTKDPSASSAALLYGDHHNYHPGKVGGGDMGGIQSLPFAARLHKGGFKGGDGDKSKNSLSDAGWVDMEKGSGGGGGVNDDLNEKSGIQIHGSQAENENKSQDPALHKYAAGSGMKRPGLLAHYLRLGQLSRRINSHNNRTAKHSSSDSNSRQRATTTTTARTKKSKHSPGDGSSGLFSAKSSLLSFSKLSKSEINISDKIKPRKSRENPRTSTINSAGANNSGGVVGSGPETATTPKPFKRLTDVLPYVSSARNLSRLGGGGNSRDRPTTSGMATPSTSTAFGTPLISMGGGRSSSLKNLNPIAATAPTTPLAGAQPTTTPTTTGEGAGPGTAAAAVDGSGGEKEQNPFFESVAIAAEQEMIEDAIRLLLVHQRFIVLLAKASMMYGSPLHHMEANLSRMSEFLNLETSFTALPGMIIISFDDLVTHTSETKIIRCPNGWDLHRLHLTNRLFTNVVHGRIPISQAIEDLEGIISAPPIYPWYLQILNWGFASWSVCLLAFNGSWLDSAVSFILGVAMGVLGLGATTKLSGYANFFEVSCSIISGFIATALQKWVCYGAITLSGTVVILPGLLMTTGVIELASRHMVAGTVRLFYALLLAFIIAFGLFLGNQFYVNIFERNMVGSGGNSSGGGGLSQSHDVASIQIQNCQGLSLWWTFFTLPAAITSISILMNIHWRHVPSVNILAGAMYAIFWLFNTQLNMPELAVTIASFVLGVLANIWCKWTQETAYMVLLPGEMILVPGSVGVRGLSMMFAKETSEGSELALKMIVTSLSIMTGLFASSFVVYPRGRKHSALLTV